MQNHFYLNFKKIPLSLQECAEQGTFTYTRKKNSIFFFNVVHEKNNIHQSELYMSHRTYLGLRESALKQKACSLLWSPQSTG